MDDFYIELIDLAFNLQESLAFNELLVKEFGRVVYRLPIDNLIRTEFFNQLEPFGLIVNYISISELREGEQITPHIDHSRSTAINIPLIGNFIDNPIWWGTVSHVYTCPTAINVGIVHHVKTIVDGPRVVLTVGIKDSWAENLPKFKKFNNPQDSNLLSKHI